MHICFRHTGHPVEVFNHEWKRCHLRHFRYIFFTKWLVLAVPLKRHSGTTLWRKRVPNWNYSLRCSVNDRVKWSRENDRISRVIRVRFFRESKCFYDRDGWLGFSLVFWQTTTTSALYIQLYIKETFLISTVNATHAVVSNCHLEHCIIKYFGKRKTKELSRMKLFSTLMLLTSLVAVPSTGARIRGDNEKVRTIVRESLHSCHVWWSTNKNSTQRTLTSHSRSFCFF